MSKSSSTENKNSSPPSTPSAGETFFGSLINSGAATVTEVKSYDITPKPHDPDESK